MDYGSDIYTEAVGDPDTLARLGPLAAMAGTWEGEPGRDEHPVAEGTERDVFVEHYVAEPIDAQTNGPQLLYGLRYHTHIVKPGETETFHDQVGYWLWEPAAETVMLTLGIPRGQVLLASGPAAADATSFELTAELGTQIYGICSNPFLDENFRTTRYRIAVDVNDDGTWSYEEEGTLLLGDRPEAFPHTDRNTLHRVSAPTPNPLAMPAAPAPTARSVAVSGATAPATPIADLSLGIGSLRTESENLP
jgi:hypothetical protein